MSEEEIGFIVCMRVTDAIDHVEGCIMMECCECTQPVWVAPSSQQVLGTHPNVKMICNQDYTKTIDPTAPVRLVPGALEEVAAQHGSEAAEVASAWLGRINGNRRNRH